MFGVLRTWDNRQRRSGAVVMLPSGKSWTRRIQWLEDGDRIKLKLQDGDQYREVLVNETSAETVWQRFKEGQPINDCISILGTTVPESLHSRKKEST